MSPTLAATRSISVVDEHVGRDECLSFFLAPELVDAIGGERAWRSSSRA